MTQTDLHDVETPARLDAALPSLYRDRAFWGMTATQFFGALNDGVFKQIVLLLCVNVLIASSASPVDQQFLPTAIFAFSFVLFSGISGWWADRTSKRTVVVLCKVAEIVVMLLAVAAFALMSPRIVFQKQVAGNLVTLTFNEPGRGVFSDPAALRSFALAGADGAFHPASATLRGDTLELTSQEVASPSLVRWGQVKWDVTAPGSLNVARGVPWLLFGVLFLMGTQSAVFGPAKYGILPELVRERELPRFNGVIQMTTFLALIFGTALAGLLFAEFHDALWKAGAFCVLIAVLGTSTSLAVRRTPVAQPDAPFEWSALAVASDTWKILRGDRSLVLALAVYSLFWFVAAVVPMSVNNLGINYLSLGERQTSLMLTYVSIGIAVGFVLASRFCVGRIRFSLVTVGAWGLIGTLALLSFPLWLGVIGCQIALAVLGVFAGMIALPVQVFLQARPPKHLKGRLIGTMNLVNWVAMIFSAGYYAICVLTLRALGLPEYGTFGVTAALMLPIALLYRPTDEPLS